MSINVHIISVNVHIISEIVHINSLKPLSFSILRAPKKYLKRF